MRVTDLPQSVLKNILNQALTRANTMSEGELRFAKRIMNCCQCAHLWVKRRTERPRRCPKCFTTRWDMPTINALAQAEATTTRRGKQEATN